MNTDHEITDRLRRKKLRKEKMRREFLLLIKCIPGVMARHYIITTLGTSVICAAFCSCYYYARKLDALEGNAEQILAFAVAAFVRFLLFFLGQAIRFENEWLTPTQPK